MKLTFILVKETVVTVMYTLTTALLVRGESHFILGSALILDDMFNIHHKFWKALE